MPIPYIAAELVAKLHKDRMSSVTLPVGDQESKEPGIGTATQSFALGGFFRKAFGTQVPKAPMSEALVVMIIIKAPISAPAIVPTTDPLTLPSSDPPVTPVRPPTIPPVPSFSWVLFLRQ